MAESVVSFVVEKIGNLLIDEAKLLWGMEAKVEDLLKELKMIQCFLRDVEMGREYKQAIEECVVQLQDIAYDADDVIERYILRVALKKGKNIIKAYACFVAKCMCLQVHVVGIEIEGLTSRISNLRMRMQQDCGIKSVNEDERKHIKALTPQRTFAHFEEDFVGREDSIEELVEELLKDGEQHRVISICGIGGLGKTTLAKKVIAHDKVKNHFDGFAWACVSQVYHVRDILEGILVKLIPDQRERATTMRDDELFETLYKIQQNKRYIVVLDDIWTKQEWNGLRGAFPVKNTRSKLLLTTRNREVAQYIDPQGFIHEPRYLSAKESWELLMRRAFPETKGLTIQETAMGQAIEGIARWSETEAQRQESIENMELLRDELLEKCRGLPLAITVLGGLLAVNEWETVSKNINSLFNDTNDVSKVLALSFDNLPWHLKPCFLYLGSFPEDAEIPATEVLHMWIAEGFVPPPAYEEEREITVEDVAEQYLMELVNRGMVQARFSLSGKVKTCRLHDLMRDLCISKARQDWFLSILNIQQNDEMKDCSSSMTLKVESTCKPRRLSVNMRGLAEGNMIWTIKQIGSSMHHLRTLTFLNYWGSVKGTWEQFQPIFINCQFLRVLKLEYFSRMRGNLPESVGDLVHLRYLSLAGSAFKVLPQSLGNLVCMEFLDLRVNISYRVTVPNVLWKMIRLTHLHLPKYFSVDGLKKLQLDTLKNLRTLRNFCPKNCDVKDVSRHTNLRKLTVAPQDGADELEIIPQLAKFNLQHLQSSSFRFTSYGSFTEGELSKMSSYGHSCKVFIKGEINKLPDHKNLPKQLRKLVLIFSELEEDPMPILEKLDHLVVLLMGNAFVGKEMVCSAGGFPQLKHLVLHYLPNLEEWRVAEGAMPHLSRLGISNCLKLKESLNVHEGVYTYDGYQEIYDQYRL